MRVVFLSGFLLLSACDRSPAPLNDSQFDAAMNSRDNDPFEDRQQRIAAAKRFNANAKVTNDRIRAAYERGSAACDRLKEAGYKNTQNCPRPNPTYVELWDETGNLK